MVSGYLVDTVTYAEYWLGALEWNLWKHSSILFPPIFVDSLALYILEEL